MPQLVRSAVAVCLAGITNAEFLELGTKAGQTPGEEGCQAWYEAERALLANGDVPPVVTLTCAYYGNGAAFEGNGVGDVEYTSLRVLK